MGTDIQCHVEARRGGVWVHVGGEAENPELECAGAPFGGRVPRNVMTTRNYGAFAILAGVCGSVRTRRPPRPLSPPKGLPPDASETVAVWFRWWGPDAHDASWLTLSELENADWNQRIYGRGVVPAEVAARLTSPLTRSPRYEYAPGRWAGPAHGGHGVEVEWTETYRDAFGEEPLRELLALMAGHGGGDEVRIVFWFSS